jgi:quercetin dioxygenase-like cupin family protein
VITRAGWNFLTALAWKRQPHVPQPTYSRNNIMILERQQTRQWNDTEISGMRVANVWNENEDGSYFVQFNEGTRFPMHDHNGWEQILMLSGRIRFGDIELSAGDTLLLKEGDVHDALALSDATFFVAHRGDITLTN